MTYITCPKCKGKKQVRSPGLIMVACGFCGGAGLAEQLPEIKKDIPSSIEEKQVKEIVKPKRGRPKKVTKETKCQKAEEDTTTE